MYEANQAAVAKPAEPVTLNERLNKAHDSVLYQCERIEAVMARVNGTPTKLEKATNLRRNLAAQPVADSSSPKPPMLSMMHAMENLENQIQRLVELSGQVERIA